MAIDPLVVTRGYGNGTFLGTIAKVVTAGYTIGAAAAVTARSYVFRLVQRLVYNPASDNMADDLPATDLK